MAVVYTQQDWLIILGSFLLPLVAIAYGTRFKLAVAHKLCVVLYITGEGREGVTVHQHITHQPTHQHPHMIDAYT